MKKPPLGKEKEYLSERRTKERDEETFFDRRERNFSEKKMKRATSRKNSRKISFSRKMIREFSSEEKNYQT